MTTTGFEPRTGRPGPELTESTPEEARSALDRAALVAPSVAEASPTVRGGWLRAVADALEVPATAEELVALADSETALGLPRLTGELARTASQLRFYASVGEEGSWLGVTLDPATDTAPALARVQVPLGPVAVFGASNFPFAFGVLGNDTASALAAGCPVVVKAHPAHPQTSVRLVEVAVAALAAAGAPDGVLAMVSGFAAGTALVSARHTAAVGFTGSQGGGLALWRLANERDVVIPVYAEMGTVNPVVVTPEAATRMDEVAAGFVGSFTLGAGQYCTKPGLLLVPRGTDAAQAVGEALRDAAPQGWALTRQIANAAATGIQDLIMAGARVVAQVSGPDTGWGVSATVLTVERERLRRGSRLLEECFGPVALVVEYDDVTQVDALVAELQGALVAGVITGGPQDPHTGALVRALTPRVGRVAVDGWPTGVAWTWAQQHGGPWPATSAPATTSVGGGAVTRWTRPVAYQNVPDEHLPAALQADNPWRLPRRVAGVHTVAGEPAP